MSEWEEAMQQEAPDLVLDDGTHVYFKTYPPAPEPLAPAQGIILGALLGTALWGVLALVTWFVLIFFNVHV